MKNRIGVVVLALLCLGLGVALVVTYQKAETKNQEATTKIGTLSNNLVQTTSLLEETRQVAASLEKDLDKQRQVSNDLTNSLSRVSSTLQQTAAVLETTKATLVNTEEELKKRDAKIGELENQNQALDKQALELSNSLTNLTQQIAERERKLAASEGDKAFLEKELKRMMTEKAELERQFNDLTVLRAQVSKLKEELSIARRIEWIRKGLFASSEQKGAQKLMQPSPASQTARAPKPSFDLNVEVNADGTVRVIPPGSSTNAPATTNSPAPQQ